MVKEKNKTESKKKLQLAFYWAASCGGCEIAVLDIDEKILDVIGIAGNRVWIDWTIKLMFVFSMEQLELKSKNISQNYLERNQNIW